MEVDEWSVSDEFSDVVGDFHGEPLERRKSTRVVEIREAGRALFELVFRGSGWDL